MIRRGGLWSLLLLLVAAVAVAPALQAVTVISDGDDLWQFAFNAAMSRGPRALAARQAPTPPPPPVCCNVRLRATATEIPLPASLTVVVAAIVSGLAWPP